ncbi:Peroxin 13, N-terminal region-domain-containing protein [Boletus coccyginus]|nr:Peroxin 13, N-terminal region-domain-containing protein [Boletus coccyginus]
MGRYGYSGYGANGLYAKMPGMGMDPNNLSLIQALETTTQYTFFLLHSIVQTFSGIAQMLESIFIATHSSFFAMVGVNALGSMLGLFRLVRWMKELITGKPSSSMQGEFRAFINGRPIHGPHSPPASKPSRKPLIIFFLAIFGIPYAMSKLIKILNKHAHTLTLKKDEIVAIMEKLDFTMGTKVDPWLEVESEWWRGQTCDGREG